MSKPKVETTIATINIFNNKIKEMRDVANLDSARLDGMRVISLNLASSFENQISMIDSNDTNGTDPAIREHIKRYMKNCISIFTNALKQIETNNNVNKGKIATLDTISKELENMILVEKNKLEALEKMEQEGTSEFSGPLHRRPPGIHPPAPLSSKRRKKDSKDASGTEPKK